MKLRLITCLLAAVHAAGCMTVGPDYLRPSVGLPDRFHAAGDPVMSFAEAAAASDRLWWREMGDPVLGTLVDQALAQNLDLRIAAARVRGFEARLAVTDAQRLPQVGYSGSAGRERVTERGAVPLPLGIAPTNGSFGAGLRASWEVDLWGRVRRADEAAMADLMSAREARDALVMSLVAEVASTYVQLVALDSELVIAAERLSLLDKRLALVQKMAAGGTATDVAVAQARADRERAAAALPPKERQVAALEFALSGLVGAVPGPVQRGQGLPVLRFPAVPAGLPSSLLERRPDVRRAEQDLIAANARIGVARSQFFPTVSLTALAGAASATLSDLTLRSANTGSVGVGIVGMLFDGGRIEGEVKQAEAYRAELVDTYRSVIQRSLREVEDALVWRGKSIEQLERLQRTLAAQDALTRLVTRRYEGGSGTLLEVIDAELSGFDSRLDKVQTERDVLSAGIAIYRSLGGGWITNASELSASSALAN